MSFMYRKAGKSVTEAGLMCMEAGMDVEMQNCVGFNESEKSGSDPRKNK